jgi:hypothetical protein
MEPAHVVIAIAVVAFIWIYSRSSARASPTIKPGTFSQAGVVVDYAARTIAIGSKTYPVDAVRGLRSAKEHNRSVAYITLTDLATPVHRINFNYHMDAAQTFLARLEAAIEQAGGPRFR